MSTKLNKIAKMYSAASAMSNTPQGKGSAEEMEKAVEEGTERTLKNKKRSKKLEFDDEEGMKVDK